VGRSVALLLLMMMMMIVVWVLVFKKVLLNGGVTLECRPLLVQLLRLLL